MKLLRTLLLLLISILLTGCNLSARDPITKSGFYFDTIIQITIYDSDDTSLLDTCFTYCEEFENLVSRTKENSDISRINNANGTPVTVSDTTIELLEMGIHYGELTNGAFDITIAPLSELWDFKNNPGIIPSPNEISDTLSHVNYKNIRIKENTVTLTDPEAAIDLGGIAKGYMADRLKEYLKNEGIESALINLGGNILALGEKPDGTAFHIGIQKPFDRQNASISSVPITDSSVVTSGAYERYFEVDNQIYHHILNTESGYPCNNELFSVTILSKDSIVGDALSTSCFALGLTDAKKLIDSLDGIEAIFITNEFSVISTANNN